ncbi:hypothetical protein HKX48_006018 [Thoreauomyces humboldtii]|nr:hypothetical protein HKX48_006018 [Thoreauomyces humboldtii]
MPSLELRSHKARKEKEQDKLLLQLSLDLDQEFLLKAKSKERAKMAIALNDAEYNRAKASEQDGLRRNRSTFPVGNMFEDRDQGPDPVTAGQQLASGLQEQIAARQIRKAQDRLQSKYENGVLNQRLTEDLKKAEIEAHIEKLRKRTQQHEMLAEQMRIQKATSAAENVARAGSTTGIGETDGAPNPFARSENLMLLYQKQKAKQLYQEQLAIVKQKREHEMRLSYDLRNTAYQKNETRRSLEHYWDQQIALKRKLRSQVTASIC